MFSSSNHRESKRSINMKLSKPHRRSSEYRRSKNKPLRRTSQLPPLSLRLCGHAIKVLRNAFLRGHLTRRGHRFLAEKRACNNATHRKFKVSSEESATLLSIVRTSNPNILMMMPAQDRRRDLPSPYIAR
jgi:hypothetical protein